MTTSVREPPSMSDRDVLLRNIVLRDANGQPQLDEQGQPKGIGLSEDDADLTALGLLKELQRDYEKQTKLLYEAEVRERIVLGEQWHVRDPIVESTVTETYVLEGVVSENLLYPLVGTYGARVRQDLETPLVYPVHPVPEEIEAAKAGEAALEYERRQCDENALGDDALFLAQVHGDCLMYPTWDESAGPTRVRRQRVDTDPATGIVIPAADDMGAPVMEEVLEWGAIHEEVIAAPDYWTDIVDEDKDASYRVVRRIIAPKIAQRRLTDAGFPDAKPAKDSYARNPVDIDRRGVEAFEVWHRPRRRFDDGLYLLIIGGYVVKAIPFPYEHGELPGSVFKIGKVRGSPRGKTHVSDAIHQQRLVNTSLRAVLRRADVSGDCALLGPSAQVDLWTTSGRKRVPSDLAKDKDARWIAGPDIPAGLFQTYDRARRALYDVFGVNEATSTGGDPTDTQSGEQLKTAAALDAQKIAPVRRAFMRCRRIIARQKLKLATQYWDDARLVRVVGADGIEGARYIRGADLQGADVAIEDGSGRYASHLGHQAGAEQEGQAGYTSPQAAAERRLTGLGSTQADAQTMIMLDRQAVQALQGQPQQPMPGVDAATAVSHLSAVLHSAMGAQGHRDVLLQLIAAYQQPQPQQALGGAPQPSGMQPSQGGGRAMPSVQQQAAKVATTPEFQPQQGSL